MADVKTEKRGRRFRQSRITRVALAYVLAASAWGVSLTLIQRNYDADQRRDREVAHKQCLERQSGRETFRQVIVIATSGGGGGADYSRFPSFANLDPAMQMFLRELSAASSAGSGSNLREQLLAEVPSIECPALE